MKNSRVLSAIFSGILMSMSSMAFASIAGPAVENGGFVKCANQEAAYSLECIGGYCSQMESNCDNSGGYVYTDEVQTGWFSDPNGVGMCPDGYVVNGYQTQGWDTYGDNVQLSCVHVDGMVHDSCSWSDWISEEPTPNPWPAPAGGVWNPAGVNNENNIVTLNTMGTFIAGMQCDGAYCDNMRIYGCSLIAEPITPPAIDLGPEHTRTPFTSAPFTFVEITDFTHNTGWYPTKVVIGISTTSSQPLNGGLWINGTYVNLSVQSGGWYTQIEIPYTAATTVISGLFEGVSAPFSVDWWFN